MSHSDSKPAGNAKQSEKMTLPNLPDIEIIPIQANMPNLDIIPLSSTSKEQNENNKSITITSVAHIVPLQCSDKDGSVKYIQVSPIKSLPKKNVPNLIKIPDSSFPMLNIDDIRKIQANNNMVNPVVLKPFKNVPLAPGKISGPAVGVVKKSLGKNNSNTPITLSVPSSSKIGGVLTNRTLKRTLPSPRTIPAILQKRAKLDALKNKPSTSNHNANTDNQISTSLEDTKILNAPTTSQDTKTYDKQKNQTKLFIEIKMSPSKEATLTKIDNEKRKSKPVVKKDKSPKKKQKDKSKEGNSWRNEETLYIADGFREDVENLVEKCLLGNKLNFERFCDLWKEMEFPCIFHGRQSGAELAELSEEVIHIAKSYMLAKNDNFEENVAGIFLVYALLNHQPFTGFASLRLVPKDVPVILSLEAEARRQKRHDVLFVLGSILIKGPCQFHVLEREVSMESTIRKYYDGTVQTSGIIDNVCNRNSPCLPLFKKLIHLDEKYAAVQKELEKYREEDKTVQISTRPAADLYKLFLAHIPRDRDDDQAAKDLVNEILPPSRPREAEKRADLIKSIKERAMINSVDTMKHLTGIDERQQDLTPSSSDESEVESKTTYRKLICPGRSNSSALALQKIFFCEETIDDLEASQEEIPTISDKDSTTPDKQKKKRLFKKKTRRKFQADDSVNELTKKTIGKKESENGRRASKQKKTTKNQKSLDVLDCSNPQFDLIEINEDDIDEVKKRNDNNNHNPKNTNKQITNCDMPSITIEIERIDEEIVMETKNVLKIPVETNKDNKPKGSKDAAATISVANSCNDSKDIEENKEPEQVSEVNTAKKIIPIRSKVKMESPSISPAENIKSKTAEHKQSEKTSNIENTDLLHLHNESNPPDLSKRKNGSSSKPLLGPDKSPNVTSPELLQSPRKQTRKAKSAIDNTASPKIMLRSVESALKLEIDKNNKNDPLEISESNKESSSNSILDSDKSKNLTISQILKSPRKDKSAIHTVSPKITVRSAESSSVTKTGEYKNERKYESE